LGSGWIFLVPPLHAASASVADRAMAGAKLGNRRTGRGDIGKAASAMFK
jgi:hypothetical protein